MKTEQLTALRVCFERYVETFEQDGAGLPPPLALKAQHSERVARECRDLSFELGWPSGLQRSAEALGLLHDIGRFSQFAQYRTFADGASVDHGERGFEIASSCELLSRLPAAERRPILDGIRHHNDRSMPDGLVDRSADFLHLVRDADKLDIFRVVLEAVDRDGFRDLPDMLPHVSLQCSPCPEIVAELRHHRSCSFEKVRTLGDFLLMQLSWVYDLNLAPALQRVLEREIPSRLLQHVEGDLGCEELGETVHSFLRDRLDAE
ncbi:MAG: HD domain-containing protein [Deltaproteobacteria bacterium]|nr:HD domain-containing protein [Deltaproteobacteria bacterium]